MYSFLTSGSIFLIICLYSIIIYGVEIEFLRDWILGGIFQSFGISWIYYATSSGYSGPASALCNIQSIIHMTLSWVFLNQVPNKTEIIGFAIGIFGSFVLIIGKQSVEFVFGRFKK